tara:strand:+ start:41 stop:499 length:459 start_codon:yes stop_codon:yes gene_type:complete
MTPEQKAGLMQFMGQAYGQAHKQDQNIIGSSGNLQPQSQQLKQQFEQVARIPTAVPQPRPGMPHAPPPQPPADSAPVELKQISPDQAAQEIAKIEVPAQASPSVLEDQLEFNLAEPSKVDTVINLLEKQNLLLREISLKLDNGKTTKSRKQK